MILIGSRWREYTLMLLLGCTCGLLASAQLQASEAAGPEARSEDHAAFHDWRVRRITSLVRPDGWLSLVALHWLDRPETRIGSSEDADLRLENAPPLLGSVVQRKDGIHFKPAKGALVSVQGVPLRGAQKLGADEAGKTIELSSGGLRISLIERGRPALRVKDAAGPARKGFVGLDYWPFDARWLVDAQFVAHDPPRTMDVATVVGWQEPMGNPGVLKFELLGRPYQLEALGDPGENLFLIIADRTNAKESYGAGRFLYVPWPDEQGRTRIDFNRLYNPPCAFTAYSTCPLPPPENRMRLGLRAGERRYAGPIGGEEL